MATGARKKTDERGARAARLKIFLGAMPGAAAGPIPVSRGPSPGLMYKVKGKVFALLYQGGGESLSLKSDPHFIEILRAQYAGVGLHRQFLRNWVNVRLDADMPIREIKRLATQSYNLVVSKLTRKQQAELAALSPDGASS